MLCMLSAPASKIFSGTSAWAGRRLLFLYDGKVQWEGPTEEFDTTQDPLVRQVRMLLLMFLGASDAFRGLYCKVDTFAGKSCAAFSPGVTTFSFVVVSARVHVECKVP